MLRPLLDCQHPQGSISTQEWQGHLQFEEEHRLSYVFSDEVDQSYPTMKI